jgi:hypothetical protein
MESYNCFGSNNNTTFVDDNGYSNFSLRGKKYFERKRTLAAANTRTNELNTLINAPDVIDTVPLPVNPPPVPVNPATLLDIGEVNPNVPVRPNPTLPLVPTDAKVTATPTTNEVISSETSTTLPNLGTSTTKNNKIILPTIVGAALLTVVLVVLLKKKK